MKKLSGGIRKLLETWGLGLEVNSCSRKEKIVENICFDIIIIVLYLFLFFFILCLTVV